MNTRFLFPHSFKRIGWMLFIPSFITGLITYFMDYQFPFLEVNVFALFDSGFMRPDHFLGITTNNLTDEILLALIIASALMIACSKEKVEDEYIAKVRLDSLLWATYINYGLLIIATFSLYGSAYFTVMTFNMFTLLLIFLIRFNYVLYKNANAASDEK